MTQPNSQSESVHNAWTQQPTAQNEWLKKKRQEGLDSFDQLGFPTRSIEAWRYTDLRELASLYPEWLSNSKPDSDTVNLDALLAEQALRLVFSDATYRPDLSDALPDYVVAGSSNAVAAEHPEAVTQRWGALADNKLSGLISLNTAFGNSTVSINVPDNQSIDRPIYLFFTGANTESVTLPRVLINLGANSEATVIEHYASPAQRIVNAVTEIECAANSRLRYYKVQDEAADSWHTAAQFARIANNAQISSAHVDLGAGLSRNELSISLEGRQAHAECSGLFVASGTAHSASRITVTHAAPDTTSRERFRGILGDRARGVFNGKILVNQIAQKTSAELTNRNLLLSPGAEINTKPELEIYADDVKCAHGSTTGQLDEQALFYLLSRGLPENVARGLLIRAFAGELISDLNIDSLSDRVTQKLDELGEQRFE